MAISYEFDFEIASIVLPLVLVHALVDVSLRLQGLLNTLKVIIPLIEFLNFLV